MRSIEMPPFAPTLIESTRAIGYSLEAAVADILDNSIAAGASRVDLFFPPPTEEQYIAILDDGAGMNAEQLSNAMRYGSRNPGEKRDETDLGRFGLGLKTASLSQCRVLTVASKQGDNIEARRWDLDHVASTKKWSLQILSKKDMKCLPYINELAEQKGGTLVIWQNLDRLQTGELETNQMLGRKMDLVREHLSLVFHRFINGDARRMLLYINNYEVKAADPFLVKKSTLAMSEETIVLDGYKVIVRPYILPHLSRLTAKESASLVDKEGLRKDQGFYVYRGKRLIVWGTWFRMMRKGELSKLARVQVDVPNALDHLWTLDIKKSSAMPPAAVQKNLKSVIEHLAEQSKRTWKVRGRKETDDSAVHIWQRCKGRSGGYFYQINQEHPLIADLIKKAPELKRSIELLLKHIAMGLPVNQLFLDLSDDTKIENDADMSEKDVEESIKQLILLYETDAQRNKALKSLEYIEPFMNYPELLVKYMKKGAQK